MARTIPKIDKILQRILRKMDLDSRIEGHRIWFLWGDIVGEQIARRTQPDRLRNRILFVRVSSSTWMQQLQTLKPVLLEKIHKVIKGDAIKDIRFSLGEVNPPSQASSHFRSEHRPQAMRLSAEMEKHLEQVKDSELRTLMRRMMLKQAGMTVKRGEN